MRQLEKIPRDQRDWDVLKTAGDPETSEIIGKLPGRKGGLKAGETEVLWERRPFEEGCINWLKSNPIPAFLLADK